MLENEREKIRHLLQYGSVKAESVIDDMEIRSLNSLSSTSVAWFFGAKL